MADWYTEGADAYRDSTKKKSNSGSGGIGDPRDIFRFYVPKSSPPITKRVMLLQDQGFNCPVHQFEVNGNWGNFVTCPKKTGVDSRCPLCEEDNYASMVSHYTIVDISGWEDGSTGDHRMGIKILPAKTETVDRLDYRRKKIGTLTGAIFEVTRIGKVAVGDEWDYVDRISPQTFLEENLDALWKSLSYLPEEWGFWEWKSGKEPESFDDLPADYRKDNCNFFLQPLPFLEILQPVSYEETAEYINSKGGKSYGKSAGGSSSSNSGYGSVGNDVPF